MITTVTTIPAPPADREAWTRLADQLTGALLLPGDEGYEAASTPWNVAVPSRPAAVVRVADAADVAAAVTFAATAGLLVDVRATGHGAAPADARTLLVHTGDLDELEVHPDGWARVGAGLSWGPVVAAAAPYGLAPVCGSAPGVGVVGFLTGGGLGPVARSVGLGSDHVRSFDVVTGDGVLRRASAAENPDLFWGLRGGKGALGIVTAAEIDLPTQPTLVGGALYFDGADASAVAHAWRTWVAELPDQATTSLAVLQLPAAPSVPPALAGRCSVAVRFAWTGDAEAGLAAFAPMREVAPVIFGGVGPMPYAAIGLIHADPVDPMPVTETAQLLHSLDAAAVDALIEAVGPGSGSPQFVVELRHLGGAVARSPEGGDAVSHRDTAFALICIGIGVPPLVGPVEQHAARLSATMAPWTTGGTLPNFGGYATAANLHRRHHAATLDRLRTLAAAYDPQQVLACGKAWR